MKFNLRQSVDTQVDIIAEWTKLDKKTIYRMSIYHGIESIKKGFLPEKRKMLPDDSQHAQHVDIPLSREMNKEIEDILLGEYYRKNKITKTALIEQFVVMEINRLNAQFINSIDSDDTINSDDKDTIHIRIEVPKIIKENIRDLADKINIADNQLYKYLLLTGYFRCIDETLIEAFVFDSDVDIILDKLGIEQTKAVTLLQYFTYSNIFHTTIEDVMQKKDSSNSDTEH